MNYTVIEKNKVILEKAKNYFLLGLESMQKEYYEEAEQLLSLSLSLIPDRLSTLTNLIVTLIKLEKIEKANGLLNNAISLYPKDEILQLNQGILLFNNKNYNNALSCFDKLIEIKGDYADAFFNRGNVLYVLMRLEEALESYDKAIEIMVNYADAYIGRGNVLRALNRLEEALESYDKAIEIKDNNAYAYVGRGNVLKELNQLEEALKSYDIAIGLKGNYAEAFFNQANVLHKLKRLEEALDSYNKSIEFSGNYADAYNNRGNVLQELMRLQEALESYNRAIEIKGEYAEAFSNRGIVLHELKRFEEALENYDKAIELKEDFAEAFSNKGNVLNELNRLEESLESYDKAIELNCNYAFAYNNRGNLLKRLKRLDEALFSYEIAYKLNPEINYLFGTIFHTKMLSCIWQDFSTNLESLLIQINQGKKASLSFPVLSLVDSPSIQLKTSEIWINDKHPLKKLSDTNKKELFVKKIKIGYFSADFREHPVSNLCVELFEIHNRNKFEIIGFYSGPSDSSNMHRRVLSAFDKFIDIRLMTDAEVAKLSIEIGIDIAIDLTGNTENERIGVFSFRAAPIQVSYLGYLGTIGATYYDYLIADKIIIPIESQKYYKEKIVYLPSYQVNDSKRKISHKVFTKAELNIPETSFVFCCLNNNYKITPSTFDGWMRILHAVSDSILFLYADNKWAEENLKLESEKRGISKTRIIFGSYIEKSEYLARYKVADLFLDTLPYNAGTTASDALWAGLPVLTCLGESFASRMAASLLRALEIPELITITQEQYEATAIELACNPEKLKKIKLKLEFNKKTTVLFDSQLFTKHLETAYALMYKEYQSGLPNQHIYIHGS